MKTSGEEINDKLLQNFFLNEKFDFKLSNS